MYEWGSSVLVGSVRAEAVPGQVARKNQGQPVPEDIFFNKRTNRTKSEPNPNKTEPMT